MSEPFYRRRVQPTDPSATLNLQLQLMQIQQRNEQFAQAREEDAIAQALKLAESGLDTKAISQAIPHLPARGLPLVEGIAKQRKTQESRQALGDLQTPARAGQFMASVAPVPTPGGGVQYQPEDQAYSAFLSDPRLAPEDIPQATQYLNTLRQAAHANTQGALNEQKFSANLTRGNAAYSAGLQRGNLDYEIKARNKDADIDGLASRIAAFNAGVTGPEEAVAVAEEFKRFGADGPRVAAEAQRRALALRAKERMQALGPQGRSDQGALADAVAAETGMTRPQALMWINDHAAIDPVLSTPENTVVVPTKNAKKFEESRYALAELMGSIPQIRSAWEDVKRRPGGTGPLVGTQGVQEFYRALGQQTPEAARYEIMSREFVSKILKARQGSRPSDFDLRFYMALMPSLTEVFSPAAEARFRSMEESLSLQASSVVSPAVARQIQERRAQALTADDRQIESAAQQFADGKIGYQQFNDVLERWKGKRAGQFTLGGVGDGAGDTTRARTTVDSLFGPAAE